MRYFVLFVAMFLMAVGVSPGVRAQDTCFYDFTLSTAGWGPPLDNYATYIPGEGWKIGSANVRIWVGVSVPGETITGITLNFNQSFAGSLGLYGPLTDTYPGKSGSTWTQTGISYIGGISTDIYEPISVSAPDSLRLESIILEGVSCDEPPEETELTRPLQIQDRLFAAQSIQENTIIGTAILANQAVIFGSKVDALVSAVIDGTVTQIEPLTTAKCYELFEPAIDSNISDAAIAFDHCRITLVSEMIGDSGKYVDMFSPINNPPPAYVIHIAGVDGREYLQIATHVDEYVVEGQTVAAGCWLGRVLKEARIDVDTVNKIGTIVALYSPVAGTLLQVFAHEDTPFAALTAVWVIEGGTYINASGEYLLDPSDSAPCNVPEGYEGCLGDSRLEDPSAWQSTNSVSWTDPGALMPTDSIIGATFNLDPDRQPVVIIGASSAGAYLAVEFGTANHPLNLVKGPTEIEIAAGDPDEGEFYSLRLKNTALTPITISFICVLHDVTRGGEPGPRPPVTTTTVCYFIDSSFENGLTSWETSEEVESDDGAAQLPDDATIEQDIALTAGTYTLRVVTEVWGTAAYNPDDEDITGGITLEYAYPDSTFVSMGTKTWASYSHRTQTFTAEIVIATDEDGTFTLRPNLASSPTGVLGVTINSACLTKAGEIPGGDGDGLITPSCGTIAIPTLSATQPGTWTTWLWAQLNKFFRCELIKVINSMHTAMVNFFRVAMWNIRWTQAAVIRFGNFTSSGFYWLNGHLHNIAVGRVYQIEGAETIESYGDLGDVLLGGLKSVIDVFIDLLQRIIDFVFYLLNLVFQLALSIVVALIRLAVILVGLIIGSLGQLFDLLNALFFAWNNSTATPIAGLPQCAIEPKGNPICIFLWTLENTIFSGRGFLFIPFIVAYGSAELLLWAVAKFSKRAQDTGQSG